MKALQLGIAMALLLSACHHNGALIRRAAEGDPIAQYEYGRRLLTGQKGVPRDEQRAAAWLYPAAAGGYAPAQAALALCYERGLGMPRSESEALRWYRRAAEQGNGNACMVLYQYELKQHHAAAAIRWLRALAETDNPAAQLLLGRMYLDGSFGADRRADGVRYIRFAAMQGNREACRLMAACYAEGIGVPPHALLAQGWLANAADAR